MTAEQPERILRVNLTTETVTSEVVPPRWRRQFLGGKGLGARYLYDELEPGTAPLGPENVLCFMLGPLSGHLPGDVRYAAVTKSPLTGTFLDSYSGGSFAASLAGSLGDHLGIVLTGKADEPTILRVENESASLEDGRELVGLDTVETAAAFPDANVACIGPAGENQVRYATIASDGGEHHAGRGGAGAVLGSKRCKAIVAVGDPIEPTVDSTLLERYTDRYLGSDVGRWQCASGTLETIDFANEVGVLSTRGWREGEFEGTDRIGIEATERAATEREHDHTIPGGFRIETADGEYVPRGATAMSLGAGLGVDDFDAVSMLGHSCDKYGIDVISAGNAIAWAINASEAAVLDRELTFGDECAAGRLLEEIVTRDGQLGDALADGVVSAVSTFGGDDLVPTVKSMEVPAYDPRGSVGMALAYATSDRGACHRRSLPVEREALRRGHWSDADRIRVVIHEQNVYSTLWSLVADDFSGSVLSDDLGVELLSAIGLEYEVDELLRVGERIWTLTRLFNNREGFDRSDDDLPQRFSEPIDGGPADGASIDEEHFDNLLQGYYDKRGWDSNGYPTRELLDELELLDVIDDETPLARVVRG